MSTNESTSSPSETDAGRASPAPRGPAVPNFIPSDDAGAGLSQPLSCGDGEQTEDEACDDGNRDDGDGCAGDCAEVSLGYICLEAGAECVRIDVCGDGRRSGEESCDDGNSVPADGCNESCAVESDWVCSQPGQPCVFTVECGDGRVSGSEQCDDGGTVTLDGCDADCNVEPGWECEPGAARCSAKACGDGLLAGGEGCDDANDSPGDGCSETCALELGFVCAAPGQACRASVCGDGIVEGGEGCDDGDDSNTGDGCSPGCRLEPNCDNGACTTTCGDGIRLPSDNEGCDDGNRLSGDGCDAQCEPEAGFVCFDTSQTTDGKLLLPIVYRDFRAANDPTLAGLALPHPDFQTPTAGVAGVEPGLVLPNLGLDATAGEVKGKPVFSGQATTIVSSAASFNQWYRSVPTINQTVIDTLELTEVPGQAGTFSFSDTSFFPLDEAGWVATLDGAGQPLEDSRLSEKVNVCGDDENHNFYFTSELTYWFEYRMGADADGMPAWPVLEFFGDDDVWVFINRKLALDIGGIHLPEADRVTLDTTAAAKFDLEVGKVYEIKVFQAERRVVCSAYKLTLSGFTALRTQCESFCGDGIRTSDEACDDGIQNGKGYGFCTKDCTQGPRCGDAVVQAPEEACDNGVNLDGYEGRDGACAPGCVAVPNCGDARLDSAFGEQSDDGIKAGPYGGCNEDCSLGPRCGDKLKQAGEECDDGNLRNGDGCNFRCEKEVSSGPK